MRTLKNKATRTNASRSISLLILVLLFCCSCVSSPVPASPHPHETPATAETEQSQTDIVEKPEEAAPEAADGSSADDAASSNNPIILGDNIFMGTCTIVSTEELLKLQGLEGDGTLFGAEPTDRFALVRFDSPQPLLAHAPGESDMLVVRDVDMICVAVDGQYTEGDISYWEPYNGKQVIIQIDHMSTWNPSDARLPLGTPHTGTAVVLDLE